MSSDNSTAGDHGKNRIRLRCWVITIRRRTFCDIRALFRANTIQQPHRYPFTISVISLDFIACEIGAELRPLPGAFLEAVIKWAIFLRRSRSIVGIYDFFIFGGITLSCRKLWTPLLSCSFRNLLKLLLLVKEI